MSVRNMLGGPACPLFPQQCGRPECPPPMSPGCVLAILVGVCICPRGHQVLLLTLRLGPSLSSYLKCFPRTSLLRVSC